MASWDEVREAYLRSVENGLDDVAGMVQSEAEAVIEREAVDEGTLLRSGVMRRPERFERVVAFTAEHASKVHDGQEPGTWVPFKELRPWVKRNLRIRPESGNFVFKPLTAEGTRSPREREIDDATRAVQHKIFNKGVDPVPFGTIATSRVRPRVAGVMQGAINQGVAGLS